MSVPDERLPGGVRRGFRLPFTSARRAQTEVNEELSFHFEMAVQELEKAGHSAEEARRLAEERFGDVDAWRERLIDEDRRIMRRVRRRDRWEIMAAEARQLLRGLAGAPVFTLGIILTLAIGIGANATMFAVVDRLLLRPPEGVTDAADVRRVWSRSTHQAEVHNDQFFSYPGFVHIRDEVPGFADVGAYSLRDIVSGTGPDAIALRAGVVTGGYFSTLGTRAALGRLFVREEGESDAPGDVVVLSHSLWQRHFGGRAEAIGEVIPIGGRPMTIIGVLPEGVGSLALGRVDAWLPMSAIPLFGVPDGWEGERNMTWLRIVGRVKPGVTPAELDRQLTMAMIANARVRFQDDDQVARQEIQGSAYGIQAATGPEEATSVTVAKWLAGMSVVLLLIACANVANLLLVRGMRRQRETALRVALGVSNGRLITHAFAESLSLALVGGALALLVAKWGGALVRTVLFPEMAWPDRLLDVRVATITFVAIVLTALLAGLAPALRSARVDVLPSLQGGGNRAGSFQPSRLRSALLVTQAALCVLLLVGAGLFVRSLDRARGLDIGFDPAPAVLVSLPLPRSTIPRDEWPQVAEAAREALTQVPGVVSVARTNSVPRWSTTAFGISVPGLDSIPQVRGSPLFHSVSPEYFTTMGVQLRRGRSFEHADASANLLLVNETTARLLWPGQEALGRCIRIGQADSLPCRTVVGIVGDMRWRGVSEPAPMQIYAPHDAPGSTPTELMVRMSVPPGDGLGALEHILRAAAMQSDPRLDWADVRSLNEIIAPDYRSWRLGATMFTAFGALALLLATIGLYSVISYVVAQRTHEMGVRLALGASRARVARLVVRQGVILVGAGVLLGVTIALLTAGRLEALLFDVAPRDPLVLGVTAATLLTVAAVACLLPALRAARVNPVDALRGD